MTNLFSSRKNTIKASVLVAFLFLLQYSNVSNATAYTVTSSVLSPANASKPLPLNSGDTLEVISGTFNLGASAYSATVNLLPSTALASVQIDAGAILDYNGTTGGASTITGTSSTAAPLNIINLGTISNSTGASAIALTNSGTGTYFIINVGAITGSVSLANNMVMNIEGPSTSVSGAISGDNSTHAITLNFGIRSSQYGVVTYTTSNTISNIGTVQAITGTTTIQNAITGVDAQFSISGGATVNLGTGGNISTTGTGVFTNSGIFNLLANYSITSFGTARNNGTINISNKTFTVTGTFDHTSGTTTGFINGGTINADGAAAVVSGPLIGGNGSILNIGQTTAVTNFTTNALIDSIETIQVFGGSAFTQGAGDEIINLNTAFIVNANASATFVNTLDGGVGGTATNYGTMTFNTGSDITNFVALNNNNILTFAGATTCDVPVTNNLSMNIAAALSTTGPGTITNAAAGTIAFKTGGNNSLPITNNGNVTVAFNAANSAHIDTYNQMTISAALTGGGTIENHSGTLALSAGSTDHAITNDLGAIYNISGASSATAAVNNSGTMALLAGSSLAGNTGVINNNAGGSLNLLGTTITGTSKVITNAATATLNISGNSSTAANIINNGAMTIAANLTVPTLTSNNSSTVTITNPATLTGAYTSTGTHISFITNATVAGTLGVTGIANLGGSSGVQVTSSFTGVPNVPYQWTIISGAAGSSYPAANLISVPANSLFSTWSSSSVLVPNALVVSYSKTPFVDLATPGPNQLIAAVLDKLSGVTTNPGLISLLTSLSSATTVGQFNAQLNKLVPNLNPGAANIATQNKIFGRIENRIAAVQNEHSGKYSAGYTAGDINPRAAAWISSFGSLAKQRAIPSNAGYKGQSIGILMGFDVKVGREDLFGFGIGRSHANITEKSNFNFNTTVEGYHALMYGSNNLKHDNFFEWLFTGAFNKTTGSRGIDIEGVDFSTKSKYNFFQGSVKFNYGINTHFGDYFKVSPLIMGQYSLLNQPDYNEQGGAAALRVENKRLRNILTGGIGARMSFPVDDWWLVGSRELRAVATYDFIYTPHITTASFLAGSQPFTVIDSPSRIGLKLGADFGFQMFTRLQVQFSYDFEMRHRYVDHSGMIKLRYFL
jgi:uncharacterized protein with beta-barrel porin domain